MQNFVNEIKRFSSWNKNGFTLIEFIVVILLISILATVVLPKIDLEVFRASGYAQQSMAAIRYGQKQAIGSGCHVIISITESECKLRWNATPAGAGCPSATTYITNPASGLDNFCDNSTPESSASLPVNFAFDVIGRPYNLADINTPGTESNAQVVNLGSRVIKIEAETGYAYE